METKNKQQWTCHSSTTSIGIHGQPGPEDLSANRNGQNKTTDDFNKHNLANNDKQLTNELFNKKGLDQFLAQQVENSLCDNSRKTIAQILEDVSKLTSTEKLLLYLKLPTDQNTVSDPLRQPLNPLGSRTEISQTIMWIRTHLEEDPELSLPKQEVYNEYTSHCANNKMKPLSTADFGKVMKQVYPSVRPRRLGTRGNSRYCYAGLRKRFKLEIPQLPDLADRQKSTDRLGQNSPEINSAAWYIVKKWAEDQLGTSFMNICSLALYLVKNVCPMFQTHSAAAPLCNLETDCLNKSENQDLPNIMSMKHKEAQIQLQKKLQQREVNREQKRKLQVSLGKTIETSGKSTGKCKKSKISPVLSEKPTTILSNTIDTKESIQPLPDFNNLNTQKITIDTKSLSPQKSTNNLSRSNSNDNDIYDINQIGNEVELKPNQAGKLPLPRLPNLNKIKQPNLLLAPPKSLNTHKNRVRSQKYKNIQPKIQKCDNFSSQERNQTQVETSDILLGDDQLKDIEIITRERLISVSNVDKDALDDYLHGGNNSQEQEEELLQYFKNNTSNNNNDTSLNESIGSQNTTAIMGDDDLSNSSKSDKLSQLRLLLEQNLNNPTQIANNQTENTFIKVEKNTYTPLPTSTTVLSGTKRRVSFETSILEDPVPPSPNTRRKNFSFTPISPGPHSPNGRQSKSSSTNASPFVSPRNTPVPRSKITVNHSQTTSFVAQNSGRKNVKQTLKYKTETDFFNENDQNERIKPFIQSIDINSKCNLPMSAPPSPMLPLKQKQSNSNLLQKLLDSNSKIPYTPDYEKNLSTPISPEVSQLISSNQFGSVNSYRSQSVPLHQMTSNLMSPCLPSNQSQFNFNFENNSVPATPAAEFTEFEAFPDADILNNGLNNENLNQILNILDNTQSNQLEVADNNQNENIFNFTTSNVLTSDMNFNPLENDILQQNPINKPIRSQSIDEIGNISQKTYQLSRSVPSTPLPYKNKLEKPLELTLNNNQLLTDLYETNPKILTEQQDFLLNGTPVAKKKFTFDSNEINVNENSGFPQSLGFMINDSSNNLNNEKFNFGNHNNNNRRNLNSILEQQFENETDEFTTVPNLSN